MNTFIDYYEILQSERKASDEQLKRSYQRLVLLSHPDKAGYGQEEKFHLIQKAWSILKNPTTRRQYDAELACYENSQFLLYDTISISEMGFDADEDAYTYPCRCNGVYYLEIELCSVDSMTAKDKLGSLEHVIKMGYMKKKIRELSALLHVD